MLSFVTACAACSTSREPAVGSTDGETAPLLGAPFGTLLVLDAEVLAATAGKGGDEPMLRVVAIDGRALRLPVEIHWSYGGWHAERPETAGRGGFTVVAGGRYRLRGYEAGGWCGVPRAAKELLTGEFGPPQVKNLGFEHVFRILDGERLGDAQ